MSVNKIRSYLACIALCWSVDSIAAVESHTTTIQRLLSDTENFGYCMINTNVSPSIDCRSGWFSLDCKGDFHSKETSRLMLDFAQLAYAMESRVRILINDQRKHNGYCVIDRLDVVK